MMMLHHAIQALIVHFAGLDPRRKIKECRTPKATEETTESRETRGGEIQRPAEETPTQIRQHRCQ
jgi:hypothetical protein